MTNSNDSPHEDANKENVDGDAAAVEEDEEPLQPHELDGYLTHYILEEDLPGIEQCMDHGAQLTFRDDNSWTPVHRAAYNGKLNALKCLVEDYGADVNDLDNQGDLPLLLSLAEGHLSIVQYLIGNCCVDPKNQRIPALCLAVQLYFNIEWNKHRQKWKPFPRKKKAHRSCYVDMRQPCSIWSRKQRPM